LHCWHRAWCICRWRHADLGEQAESNRTAVVPIVPNRGLILDRNGIVLATTIRPTRWKSRLPKSPT
jgi:cell division protein FtsI/penicillin-binding protein 2